MRTAVAIVLAALAGGCIRLRSEALEQSYYALNLARPEEAAARTRVGDVLKVPRFRVSPPFEGREFVHRMEDLRWAIDDYRLFFVDPGWMVTLEARRWIERSGLFRHVLDTGSEVAATHVLEGKVLALHGDHRGEGPRAVMAIEFILLEQDEEAPRIAFQEEFRREIPLPDPSPEALVRGWSRALSEILTELEEKLGTVPRFSPEVGSRDGVRGKN